MKKNLCYFLFVLLALSCDAPRTDRRHKVQGNESFNLFGQPITPPPSSTATPPPAGGAVNESGGTVGGQRIPSEVSHCRWSDDGENGFQSAAAHLSPEENSLQEGGYTLCQSRANPLEVYLQIKSPITDAQLCLIPTYNSGGNSVYLGEPRCLYTNSTRKLYKVALIKNRQGYTSYPITGVMLMKDKAYQYDEPFYQLILSPDAYMYCSQWLALHGDPSYCIAFKSGGHYVYHQF